MLYSKILVITILVFFVFPMVVVGMIHILAPEQYWWLTQDQKSKVLTINAIIFMMVAVWCFRSMRWK